MKVTPTSLPGVLLLEPRVFEDERGAFLEAFNDGRFREAGIEGTVRQVNQSHSRANVLRGLHYQLEHPQGKLVSVVRGAIWDVAVDIRVGSPSFGRWVGMTLDAEERRQAWIPPGFAHGFCVLSGEADVVYLCTDNVYRPDDDFGVAWNDPALGITWPVSDPVLSARDRALPLLSDAHSHLPRFA